MKEIKFLKLAFRASVWCRIKRVLGSFPDVTCKLLSTFYLFMFQSSGKDIYYFIR